VTKNNRSGGQDSRSFGHNRSFKYLVNDTLLYNELRLLPRAELEQLISVFGRIMGGGSETLPARRSPLDRLYQRLTIALAAFRLRVRSATSAAISPSPKLRWDPSCLNHGASSHAWARRHPDATAHD
jgi:hypothetical protein